MMIMMMIIIMMVYTSLGGKEGRKEVPNWHTGIRFVILTP
jgi:hypothetical protein